MNDKGQFPAMNFLRLIIAIFGFVLFISGVDTIGSTSGPILDQLSETTFGWAKALLGIACMLIGIHPASIRMLIRVP